MNPNIQELVTRFRNEGVVVDTNLLLVLLVGNVDPRLVGTVARTDGYSQRDYDLLIAILRQFSKIIFLPQILTETGNLLKRNCPTNDLLFDLQRSFARLVCSSGSLESRALSRRVVISAHFQKLGYADAAILASARDRHLILTADGPLQRVAGSNGMAVLPFQWIQIR